MAGMYLRSFDESAKTIDLDTLEVAVRGNMVKTVGWYLYLEDTLSAIYFIKRKFFVRYDKSCVEVERGCFADIEKENDQYRFSLYQSSPVSKNIFNT